MLMKFISLSIYLLIAVFQIRNFIKYKKTNGANFIRICLFMINCFLIAHNARLILGFDEGYFFSSMSVVWFAMQFSDWLPKWVKEKLRI
jgi:hypothetical protein